MCKSKSAIIKKISLSCKEGIKCCPICEDDNAVSTPNSITLCFLLPKREKTPSISN